MNHLSGVDDILRYLRHIRTLGLTFTKGNIYLYATADAPFNVYPHSGGMIHLGINSASFLSITQKQQILADSSTKAEFISAHTIAYNIIWLRGLLQELGFPQSKPTPLMQDIQSTIE